MLLALSFFVLGLAIGALIATAALRRQAVDALRSARAALAAAESARKAVEAAKALPAPARPKAAAPTSDQQPRPPRARRTPKPEPAPTTPLPARPVDDGLPRLGPAGPRDTPGTVPRRTDDNPFHHTGVWDEDTDHEFPIELPEPGAVAMVEVTAKSSKHVRIVPMTRTPTRVDTHRTLLYVSASDGTERTRTVLSRDVTHLKVDAQGRSEWSVRLYGPSETDELTGTREGTGEIVVALRPDAPSELLLHVDSSSWGAEFICHCWRWDKVNRDTCRCAAPEGLPRWFSSMVYLQGEGMRTLVIPRPGLLKLHTDKPTDPWRLRLGPYRGTAEDDGPDD
ncbi:hypothetical protein ACIRS1_17910 [Kitasatospora sp. NPDC101176]|uniref:hypothetical protein n=1 Tax=Kitasatospora sp. NPDC101176 TaxID=3364099 RepID=UPI0037F7E5A3